MTRAERDYALAVTAERYVDLLRLQRHFLAHQDGEGAARFEEALEDAVAELMRLVDAQITPD